MNFPPAGIPSAGGFIRVWIEPVDFFPGLVEDVLLRSKRDVSCKEMMENAVENIVILCKTG